MSPPSQAARLSALRAEHRSRENTSLALARARLLSRSEAATRFANLCRLIPGQPLSIELDESHAPELRALITARHWWPSRSPLRDQAQGRANAPLRLLTGPTWEAILRVFVEYLCLRYPLHEKRVRANS